MALILNLETATKVCSVTLAENGKEIATISHHDEQYSHAEKLNVTIEQIMQKAERKMSDLEAIAVSKGPGSYTGLRIGTSSAKGLCYALEIPLIAVNSLQSLAALAVTNEGVICPLFDARRMEVYAAIYDDELNEKMETQAIVVDENSFAAFLSNEVVNFLGPGAEKCKDVITHKNARFIDECQVSAKGMIELSEEKFNNEAFENLAYFEPFYLKDFIAGKPKKIF